MPQVEFGLSSYQRGRGDLPELPVVNMFAEDAPTEERGIVLQSRPGLEDHAADMGAGPVQQLFKRDLVLSSELYGVSGGSLYQASSLIGAIDGSGFVSMAGNEIGLMTTAGENLYFYNGTSLSAVSFPDGADVTHVSVGGSRYWMIRKDTGKVYWTDALQSDVEALDFATAESLPDRALHTIWRDDGLVIFGAESVEFWVNTQDDDLPIQPLEGRVIEKGIKATGCAVVFGSGFAWVTNENNVCLNEAENVISNPGLQKRIEASDHVSLFTFLLDGSEFLALRLDGETQVYKGTWSEFETKGQVNWAARCFAGDVFGSAVDGKTLAWSDGHEDALATGGVLERRFRGGFPLNSGGLSIANLALRCNVGQTPFLTGDYTDPIVEVQLSRDAGQTWGAWKQARLGAQGNYRTRPQWRGLGMASQPAFLAEFRVTAPIDWRVSNVLVNEPMGGR